MTDLLQKDRERLARIVRDEMRLLGVRVQQAVKALESKTDEEIAMDAGCSLPRFGESSNDSWFMDPLLNARRAMLALAALNMARVRELEDTEC